MKRFTDDLPSRALEGSIETRRATRSKETACKIIAKGMAAGWAARSKPKKAMAWHLQDQDQFDKN
eukprot:UN18535